MFKRVLSIFLLLCMSISFSQTPNISPQIEVISPNLPPVLRQPQQNEQMLLEKKESELKQDNEKKDTIQAKPPQSAPYSAEEAQKPSRIESIYMRISPEERLKQFGYDLFKDLSLIEGAVPDTYILGPRDELTIYLWGPSVDFGVLQSRYEVKVNRDGTIYIQNLGVYNVSSMSLGSLKELLRRELSRKYKGVNVDVTLSRMRKFRVYVSGFVNNPGIVEANPTDNLITVLARAGGISKEGSLRRIELRRQSSSRVENIPVDLYDLLIKGKPIDIRLRDEDVIYVHPIGKVVGVGGSVKRPAIYEFKSEASIEEVLEFAGGIKPSASKTFLRLYRFEKDGLKVMELSLEDKKFLIDKGFFDGDFLFVGSIPDLLENSIKISGSVLYPGVYSYEDNRTIKELLNNAKPRENAIYGRVIRIDKSQVDFYIRDVLEGSKEISLNPRDEVLIYDMFPYEPIYVSGNISKPRTVPYYEKLTLLDILKDVEFIRDPRQLKAVIYRADSKQEDINEKIMQGQNIKTGENLSHTREREILPVERRSFEETREREILPVERRSFEYKGRTLSEEEFSSIKEKTIRENKPFIIYLNDLLFRKRENLNVPLKPGDVIVIEEIQPYENTSYVTILGEVKYPGRYTLSGNETLYDVILRAGGYTERAFPKGLILIRESAKRLQQEQLELALVSLEEAFLKQIANVGFASEEERQIYLIQVDRERRLFDILKRRASAGLGRIALEIPETLDALKNSPSNIYLTDEDVIIVPARPNYVLLIGDVYNQMSLPYIKGKRVKDYIEMLGGPKKQANTRDIYVIKANGMVVSSNTLGRGFLLRSSIENYVVEEGDTIVVPSEFRLPIAWRPLIRDVVQIIFQAISTAVLAKRL